MEVAPRPKKNGLKNFWVKKIFGSKKNFGSKIFLGKQIFWLKKCWVKKIRSEKLGRVNLRGRIYDPPPPDNSRVKILLGGC